MSEAVSDNTHSEGSVLTPKAALIFVSFIAAFFFLLDDVLGLIEGGGLFSVRWALHAADERTAVINVDGAGLRTLFVLLCSIIVIIPATALRANLSRSLVSFVVIMSVIGGGFVLDSIYDERIVGHFLALHGYERCENGDFHVGNGKSRVWFDDYVLSHTSCPSTPRRS